MKPGVECGEFGESAARNQFHRHPNRSAAVHRALLRQSATSTPSSQGLTRDASIGSIEVGNYGAAFIQVFASMEGFGEVCRSLRGTDSFDSGDPPSPLKGGVQPTFGAPLEMFFFHLLAKFGRCFFFLVGGGFVGGWVDPPKVGGWVWPEELPPPPDY